MDEHGMKHYELFDIRLESFTYLNKLEKNLSRSRSTELISLIFSVVILVFKSVFLQLN